MVRALPVCTSSAPTRTPSPGESSSPVPDASTPTKPTKKSTVDELRHDLSHLGLDTKGKKETLFRRLLNYFVRSTTPPTTVQTVHAQTQTDLLVEKPVSIAVPGVAITDTPARRKWGKQPIRSFLCFDVEATCRGGREFDWPNEIIEFPVVLMRWREGSDEEYMATDLGDDGPQEEVDSGDVAGSKSSYSRDTANKPASRLERVDTFHSYVRPKWQPILSEFCVNLTGITQETVNKAPTFPQMLVKLETWMTRWDLIDKRGCLKDAVWVTDGPWDLRDFIPKQLHISPPLPPSPAYPLYFLSPYLNIKQATQTYLSEAWKREQYALTHPGQPQNARALSRITTGWVVHKKDREAPKYNTTITGMVEKLGLGDFEGRQHSGLDDATNVARILTALADRDVLIEPNARLPPARNAKTWPWMGAPGEVKFEEWMSRQVLDKVPAAAGTEGTGSGDIDLTVPPTLEKAVEELRQEEEEDQAIALKLGSGEVVKDTSGEKAGQGADGDTAELTSADVDRAKPGSGSGDEAEVKSTENESEQPLARAGKESKL